MDFEAGERVRCVRAEAWADDGAPGAAGPAFEACCVIEWITPIARDDEAATYLKLRGYADFVYNAACFQPLGERELEILRALAADPKLRSSEIIGAWT